MQWAGNKTRVFDMSAPAQTKSDFSETSSTSIGGTGSPKIGSTNPANMKVYKHLQRQKFTMVYIPCS